MAKVTAQYPQINRISTSYVYFVEAETSLSTTQWSSLEQLLAIEKQMLILEASDIILVTPRFGTISAWSSKAMDIIHNCGLQKIKRIERGIAYCIFKNSAINLSQLGELLYDPMTESVSLNLSQLNNLFLQKKPQPDKFTEILTQGRDALVRANKQLGLALTDDEIDYLFNNYYKMKRNPSDAELLMFAQANSEHCRHKIFNAQWVIDEKSQDHSLFAMIRNTYKLNPEGVLSAYKDNGAVLTGAKGQRFFVNPDTKVYQYQLEDIHIVAKVETHNHPTGISPFPGAATGSGGEIRDEGAVGRGAKPKAGLVGFSVSNLHIPQFTQPWEFNYGKPAHMAAALEIMLEAPIGAASFNNEFGRPSLCGYFRTYEVHMKNSHGAIRGYHKPIMIAGGIGNIRAQDVEKQPVPVGAKLLVLGGPAMLIGIGGGAASSMITGSSQKELDFASVQRSNPEMQRRCQEVIDACWALDKANPIIAIHDVGAGGLANALPELVHGSDRGGHFDLRAVPNVDLGMSPAEIWCNEAQERYVLAIAEKDLPRFKVIAERERCPYAVIGEAILPQKIVVADTHFNNKPVDLPSAVLFGNPPKLVRNIKHEHISQQQLDTRQIDVAEAAKRILQLPCVADKSFLITIGDRSVTGLVTRDQMVGPWQIPIADVAVTASSFQGYTGEAMAMGERAPIALIHPAASARMAVGEAITNIAAADIATITDIKLSANWMAAADYPGEDAALFDAVQALGIGLCPALGICIPVGKDSLSMRTVWQENNEQYSVTSPLSVIISAFAPVKDIRKTLTPQLKTQLNHTKLMLVDLGLGCNFLGGSALAQVYQLQGSPPPDIAEPQALKNFFQTMQVLKQENLVLAYHDRSDGGLFVALCEMAFAGHTGIKIQLANLGENYIASLFNEELGAVLQIREQDVERIVSLFNANDLAEHCHIMGEITQNDEIAFYYRDQLVLRNSRTYFQRLWSETSYRMQALRDNPECAKQAYDNILNSKDPGLNVKLTFNPADNIVAPFINKSRPKVAILREQGVNGHLEMAAAFDRAGFLAIDVHMTDVISGRVSLRSFVGLAACGGFSYGDVLGAGRGWASSILYNARARDEFSAFFQRNDTFALGSCNGCQMLSQLAELIPGAELWPRFTRNQSEQFEARLSLVEILPTASIFFKDMAGSRLLVPVAHGEGYANFAQPKDAEHALTANMVTMRYVDNYGNATERYPYNPNGSLFGITGLTSSDGRVMINMPHPERAFRTIQHSWHPDDWNEEGPWLRIFYNARVWVG